MIMTSSLLRLQFQCHGNYKQFRICFHSTQSGFHPPPLHLHFCNQPNDQWKLLRISAPDNYKTTNNLFATFAPESDIHTRISSPPAITHSNRRPQISAELQQPVHRPTNRSHNTPVSPKLTPHPNSHAVLPHILTT